MAEHGANDPMIGGYSPGAIGWVTQAHGIYYTESWGLGPQFEAEVAAELADFFARFDAAHDGFWIARSEDRFAGSVTIDGGVGGPGEARLRWFIVDPARQGAGIGRRLMEEAMAFCRDRAFRRVWLDTFAGLDAARRLYEAHGFHLTQEWNDADWGTEVTHQRFEWRP